MQHGLYIFNYISAILMFYIVYNFVRETKDVDLVLRTLIILNVLVAIYSIIQITLGKQTFFGLQELSMQGARQGDEPRLVGPYGVGLTAELLVIHILLTAYLLVHVRTATKRYLLYLLISLNLACLLATGNRGGFLVLIGGAGLFLYMFRSQLGLKRTLTLSISGSFLLVLMSVVIISFTDYGVMYTRLQATEIEGGMPDTRANTWANVLSKIPEKPLLGHGPRLRLQDDYSIRYPGHEAITYPHNLYLFLLYTTGVFGLAVYFLFFGWMIVRIRRGARNLDNDPFMQGLVKLGWLLMLIFLIDQMKVEFLRYAYVDYWHYIFSIFAIWLALADQSRKPPQTKRL
jgi:O-antigen ligase